MNTPRILALGIVLLFLTASAARAVTETWDGGGGNDNLGTNNNWLDNTAPVSDLLKTDLIFAGVVRPTPAVTVPLSVHSITFDNTATAFTIAGSVLNIGTGGITNDDTQAQAFDNLISFSSVANSVINAAAGPLRFTGLISLPTGTLTVSGGFNTEFGDFNAGAILKQGTGTMNWMPPGEQAVDVTVSAGTLRFGPNISPDTINGAGSLAINGTSVLNIDEDLTLFGAPLTRASGADINLAAGKTLRLRNGCVAAITGAFTNTTNSTIEVTNAGPTGSTLTTTGTLGFNGGTTVQISGESHVTAGTNLNIGTSGNGTVTVNGSDSSLGAGSTMNVGQSGATAILTFTNTSSGGFNTINVDGSTTAGTNGTLEILSGSTVTGTGLSIAPNSVANTGVVRIADAGSTLTLTGTGAATIGATSSSAGTLNIQAGGTFQSGTGLTTVNVTGAVSIAGTYQSRGDLTINRGTLTRTSGGVLTLDPGTTLRVQNGGDATITGSFTNANTSNIIVTGAGSTLTTTSNLTFNGSTTVQVSASGDVSAGTALNIGTSSDATVTVDGSGSSLGAGSTLNVGQSGATGNLTFTSTSAGNFNAIGVDASGIAGTDGTLEILSGSTVTGASLSIAPNVAANTGLVRVAGAGAALTLTATTATTIGAASASSGTLQVQSGGDFISNAALTTVNATGSIEITGGTCSAAGNLTLNGGQLTRDAAGQFLLAPTRTFTVQAGGDAAFTGIFTGGNDSTIVVTGAGSTLMTTGSGTLQIRDGATLSVLAGGVVASAGPLNVGTALVYGAVTVNSAGSSLSVAGLTTLGLSGNTGTLEFLHGSTGTLAGVNVAVSSSAGTYGRLDVESGSAVTATGLGIGSGSGVNQGEVYVQQAGSSLAILGSGATTIGAAANAVGSLNLSSGATFSSGTGPTTVNATGTVAISDGTFLSNGNLLINGGQLTRGGPGVLRLATGTTMTVQGGGDATITADFTNTTASNIIVTGAGSTFTTTGGGFLQIGGGAALSVLAGGAANASRLYVGSGGHGTVTVSSAGANLSVADLTAVGPFGNTGTLTFLNGSTGTLAGLEVGVSNSPGTDGQLSIQSGAAVTATGLVIGSGIAANTGAANLSGAGSSLTILGAGATAIGAAANTVGTLTIQNGATFTSGTGLTTVNPTGTVAITGGTYVSNGNLRVNGGQFTRDAAGTFTLATGKTLTVQAGGDAIFTGSYTTPSSAAVAVNGVGSVFSVTDTVRFAGGTAVNVSTGGSLQADTVTFGISGSGATGTIDGATSSVSAGNLVLGENGTLTFANASTGTFGVIAVDVSGTPGVISNLAIQGGSIVNSGSLFIATASNANTGSVVISGAGSALTLSSGAFIGAASASTAAVTVQSGGTFSTGTGAVNVALTGALNVQAGGILTGAADYAGTGPITIAGAFAPGTATGPNRTTSVSFAQNLALQPTSLIALKLAGLVAGTSHDQIVFNGPGTPHVTWNGTLAVFTIASFVPQVGQVFDLLDFDAARDAGAFTSINLPVLGAGRFWRTDQLYVDGTIAVSSTPGTYAEWQSHYGTGAWDDDDDGDGLKNGIEFLLGTDPKVPFDTGLYPIEELPRLGLLARVTFDIPQLPPSDAQYAVQSSPDLVTWTTIATKTGTDPWTGTAGVTVTSDPPIAGFVNTIVSETLPAATAHRFHRLLGTEP